MATDPILAAFDRRLRQQPAATVVLAGEQRASVSDIDHWAVAIAELFARQVAEPGVVSFSAPNGLGFLAGLIALRRLRRPALLIDQGTPGAERERIARSLGAVASLDVRTGWPTTAADLTVVALDRPARLASPVDDDVAVIKLTSGSTGSPRGIQTPSAALVADEAALTRSMGLADDERILAAIPMSHSYGLSSVALPALVRRAVLVVPDADHPFAPMVAARDHDVTFMPTVPAFLRALVRLREPPPAPASLRLVIAAGAPLDPETARCFRVAYGRPVHVFYGASESGGITYDRDGSAAERGSLGTPVDGVELSFEAAGTVTVRSSAVARGAYPEADPNLQGGVFRTRDLGTLCDGELVLAGRLDDLLNIKGKKVHPREIEKVLLELDGVGDAVVSAVETASGSTQLRAVVAISAAEPTVTMVRAWCRQRLAEHKRPRQIVRLDAIPRNARGKIDRVALEIAVRRAVQASRLPHGLEVETDQGFDIAGIAPGHDHGHG